LKKANQYVRKLTTEERLPPLFGFLMKQSFRGEEYRPMSTKVFPMLAYEHSDHICQMQAMEAFA